MDQILIFSGGSAPSAEFARRYLQVMGAEVTDIPTHDVTHLLLDVPSFGPDGRLRGGGDIEQMLSKLPGGITICGGNLEHSSLTGRPVLDLLKDPLYLAENAHITAECTLDVTLPHYSGLLRGCPVLILGWGRIGKCLAQLLRAIGADVTVAARKESDRAIIAALGFRAVDTGNITGILPRFRLLYNTAPELLLTKAQTALCRPDCLLVDLASKTGIEGDHVITARGLPGIHRPEASGQLIARTLIRLLEKEEIL